LTGPNTRSKKGEEKDSFHNKAFQMMNLAGYEQIIAQDSAKEEKIHVSYHAAVQYWHSYNSEVRWPALR
jgi:hypothetical protein